MPSSEPKDFATQAQQMEGAHFFDLLGRQEDLCESETARLLPQLGQQGPLCYERLRHDSLAARQTRIMLVGMLA